MPDSIWKKIIWNLTHPSRWRYPPHALFTTLKTPWLHLVLEDIRASGASNLQRVTWWIVRYCCSFCFSATDRSKESNQELSAKLNAWYLLTLLTEQQWRKRSAAWFRTNQWCRRQQSVPVSLLGGASLEVIWSPGCDECGHHLICWFYHVALYARKPTNPFCLSTQSVAWIKVRL